MLQASEGGRVYLGRSALEIKLRETPAPDATEATPVPMAFVPTERVSLPAPIEPPSPRLQPFGAHSSDDEERPERQIALTRSTLIGICLTAFACGIVTTVALDRHHFRTLEHELRAAEQAVVAPPSPPEPVQEAPAPQAPAAPVAAPVVVQLGTESAAPVEPSKPAAEPGKPVDLPAKPAIARAAVARTPRPTAAPRPAMHHKAAGETAPDAPAAGADWVDPFAE